jgi:hypothetical protein
MARLGDWRNDKDEEIELDGIGGVNIMVKADVHRSGMWHRNIFSPHILTVTRHQLPMLCFREPGRDRGLRQDGQARRLRSVRPPQLCGLAH